MAPTRPVNGTGPSQDQLRQQEEDARASERERERNGGEKPAPQQERPLDETNVSVRDGWQHGAPAYLPVAGQPHQPSNVFEWLQQFGAALQAYGTDHGTLPFASPFQINLATLHGAEDAILALTTHLVEEYDHLRSVVHTAIAGGTTFFGGEANVSRFVHPPPPTNPAPGWDGPGTGFEPRWVTSPDERTRASAAFFTPVVHEDMKSALNAVANLIAMLGGFIKMLHDSGVAYVSADDASRIDTIG